MELQNACMFMQQSFLLSHSRINDQTAMGSKVKRYWHLMYNYHLTRDHNKILTFDPISVDHWYTSDSAEMIAAWTYKRFATPTLYGAILVPKLEYIRYLYLGVLFLSTGIENIYYTLHFYYRKETLGGALSTHKYLWWSNYSIIILNWKEYPQIYFPCLN